MSKKETEIYCANCGFKTYSYKNFCNNCGFPLKKAVKKNEKYKKWIKKNKKNILMVIVIFLIAIPSIYYFNYVYVSNESFYNACKEIPKDEIMENINGQVINNEFIMGGFEEFDSTFYLLDEEDNRKSYPEIVHKKKIYLNSSYSELTKSKIKFNKTIQKLEKVSKSDEEKEFVSLLKKQYNDFDLLMKNIKEVRSSGYTKKISYTRMHNFMVSTKKVNDFLEEHDGFASRYNLKNIYQYDYYSKNQTSYDKTTGIKKEYTLLYKYV